MLYCINATAEPSSGGGSYTPEKLVWEDVIDDKERNIVYTNTNNVPIYISVVGLSPSGSDSNSRRLQLKVDDKKLFYTGRELDVENHTEEHYSVFGIVPANSTYEIVATSEMVIATWHEARMPLAIAVGSGGGDAQPPVAFEVKKSTTAQYFTNNVDTTVLYDSVVLDTDIAYNSSNGQYVVPKDGMYAN